MRAIIMAAGHGTRWAGPEPKHFATVDGEPILHRTVRLLAERGVDDVIVKAPRGAGVRYSVPGARTITRVDELEIDKFATAADLWAGDTRHFYGDVFYTEAAMDTIVARPPAPFTFFGRRYASQITGTRHGEVFCVAATDLEALGTACRSIRAMRLADEISRGGSWELYQVLQGRPPNPYGAQHFDENWVQIDDWTEDFDRVEEYEEWTRRRMAVRAT